MSFRTFRLHLPALLLGAVLLPAAARADEPPAHHHGDDANSAVPAHQKHAYDRNLPKPTGKDLELPLKDGSAKAYVARPHGKTKGAVLVLHEWWGLNDHIRHQADLLAKEGYLALAVDLYKGQATTDPKEAAKLMGGRDEKWGDAVEEAGLEWLKRESKDKKIATIGWCMGGGESLNSSLHDPKDVSATVIYYGMPVTEVAKLKTLKGPILGIWADQDDWITKDKVEAFDKALTEAGIAHEFKHYDAVHAFANPSNGKYSPASAKDAWKRTLAFLAQNLAR